MCLARCSSTTNAVILLERLDRLACPQAGPKQMTGLFTDDDDVNPAIAKSAFNALVSAA